MRVFIHSGLSFISTGWRLNGVYTSFLSGFVEGVLALDGAVCELLVLLIFWIAPDTVLSLTLRGLSFIDSLITAGRGIIIYSYHRIFTELKVVLLAECYLYIKL